MSANDTSGKGIRLLGRACVRRRVEDGLWLLNRRERGWAECGILVGTWEELHARYNVEVVALGEDEYGRYWEVESV